MDYLNTALFDLDLEQGMATRISSEIDSEHISIQWSPNKKHAIWHVLGEAGTFLDNLNGDTPKNMNDIWGEPSCCWYWYE